jgi:hypothetical protein
MLRFSIVRTWHALVGLDRFEEIATKMSPERHFGDRAVFVEMVVHGIGIGDEVAGVAAQKLIDGALS